jgi:hypothetical protein
MDNYYGMIALDSNAIVNGEKDSGLIDIEMLRVGNFEHPSYGTLEITHELLNSMVNNFNKNILGREISFDWNHEAKKASAWLRDARVENDLLVGTVELTKSGKESVENKEYGYFSIEFTDDYKDAETGDKYGPTIMGGALTNRPFISKLRKIEFSLDDENIKLYREVNKMPEEIKREPVKVTEEADTKKDVKLEEFEKIQAKNQELEDKLKKLEETKAAKEEDVKLEEFISAQNKQLQAMEDRIAKLTEANKALEEDSKKAKANAKVSEIKLFCDKLLNDEHHHPSVVETVKDLLLENPSDEKVYKFSETVGEGDDAKTREVKISLMDVISNVLSAVPATQRANYNEKTTSDSVSLSEEEQDKLEEKAMARAFAKKNMKRLTAVK